MQSNVSVVAASKNINGVVVWTMLLEYPRYIHSEVLRHRMFSHSVSSSRAIPIKRNMENIRKNLVSPIHWGANRAGMSSTALLESWRARLASVTWKMAHRGTEVAVRILSKLGLHKQWANRLLEPYQPILDLVTFTDHEAFFIQRLDKHAQPEFQKLAILMNAAMYTYKKKQKIHQLKGGGWHLPFITRRNGKYYTAANKFHGEGALSLKNAIAVSLSCCAQTSYRTNDLTLAKAFTIQKKLFGGNVKHISPSEHICRAETTTEIDAIIDVTRYAANVLPGTLAHRYKSLSYSGNLHGFVAYRQYLEAGTEQSIWKS